MPPTYSAGIARYLVGTVTLSTVIAAVLTIYGNPHHGFASNFVYSQCIGTLTYATIDLPRRTLWPQRPPSLLPMLGLVLLAAPVGWFGGTFIASVLLGDPWGPSRLGLEAVLGFLALTAGAGLIGCYYFWTRERLMASEAGAAEARLKLLQAQIEPHFLFNTLANLQALIGVDPPRAQEMLRHLDGYLRATLATTRNDRGTLAEEFALLQGYLEILAIRMGPRLAYELDLPQALADATLPPMLLQPLVENAIRHGLEPAVEGGKVRVSARQEGRQLVLVVQDTGQGFGTSPLSGTGVGLAHVRERLAAVYANAASLETGENAGGGVCVTLRLPLQKWTPAPSSPKTNRCSPTA
jgi:signal transduction histidine kinase